MKLRSHLWTVGLAGMVSLVLVLGLQIRQRWEPLQEARTALSEIQAMTHLADVVHELQRERGLSLALLGGAPVELELTHQHLETNREHAHTAAGNGRDWLDLSQLDAQRQRIVQGRAESQEVFAYFTLAINQIVERFSMRARQHNGEELRAQLLAHLHLMRAKEQLGRLRALMTRYLALGKQDPQAELEAQWRLAVFDEYTDRYLVEGPSEQAVALRRILEGDTFRRLAPLLTSGIMASGAQAQWKTWFSASTAAIDELRLLELRSFKRSLEAAGAAAAQLQRDLFVSVGVLLLAWGVVAGALLFSLTRLMRIVGLLVVNLRRLLGRSNGNSTTAAPGTRLELSDVASFEAGWAQVLDAAERLQSQASVDALTGIFNRRGLASAFASEMDRARRHGRPLSLLILDLDHFKRINDHHGHAAGDHVLKETSERLQRTLRSADTLGRWGGEEFVVIAPESDEAAVASLAEKLRLAIGHRAFETVGPVFVSIGGAQWQPEEDLDALCARADRALYAAKEGGRNRVEMFSTLPALSTPLRLVKS